MILMICNGSGVALDTSGLGTQPALSLIHI